MEFIAIWMLGVINIFILYLWSEDHKHSASERKDLYDRLMSGTLEQYKVNVETEDEKQEEEEEPTAVDLDEARDEIEGAHG